MIEQTFLYHEIHEQPDILARLLSRQRTISEALVQEIHQRKICHVVIAARGTSDNAARYAKYLLGAHNRMSVGLAAPSLFTIYQQPPLFGDALVLGISQSGKSPDIVSVLAEARNQGVLTAAITNERDSDLAVVADYVLDLGAGDEKAVAATKTYTAELATIALLSVLMGGDDAMHEALVQIPQQVARVFTQEQAIAQMAERYRYMQACVTIGRGYNYATAYELALKLKELTYTVVEPYSSADFLHGPVALVQHGFPVILLAPSGRMLPEIKSFAETLQGREAELVIFSDDTAALELARVAVRLPAGVPEWLSPLTCIIPGQLFSMYLARARDYDVDRPRGLRKVTETR